MDGVMLVKKPQFSYPVAYTKLGDFSPKSGSMTNFERLNQNKRINQPLEDYPRIKYVLYREVWEWVDYNMPILMWRGGTGRVPSNIESHLKNMHSK